MFEPRHFDFDFRPDYWDFGAQEIVDPGWTSDKYLPAHLRDEVEIARIVLASSTMDKISIRARARRGRIAYRIVDEYDSGFIHQPRTSKLPLTLAQMISFIDGIENDDWTPDGYDYMTSRWEWDFDSAGADSPKALQEITEFIRPESVVYPDLGDYFEQRAQEWVMRKWRVLGRRPARDESAP